LYKLSRAILNRRVTRRTEGDAALRLTVRVTQQPMFRPAQKVDIKSSTAPWMPALTFGIIAAGCILTVFAAITTRRLRYAFTWRMPTLFRHLCDAHLFSPSCLRLVRMIVGNYRPLQPAADADPLGSDTSLTTSAVSRFPACRATSASATMPQQAPLSSTTGTRLI
jgi:hypothetical protein